MQADIGVIGGSGFYSLFESSEKIDIDTEYGKPSDSIYLAKVAGKSVAFIPRHGLNHTIPPHKIPYKANIEALNTLGVKRVIATNLVGSLRGDYIPGDFAFQDQFINMTDGRDNTFFNSEPVIHMSTAEPYCKELRKIGISSAKGLNLTYHDAGTVVVVNGPRFSTKAESKFFRNQGIHMINMTQYPEVSLAKERCMCYLGISLITDYDAGLEDDETVKPVSQDEVSRVFLRSIGSAKDLVLDIIAKMSVLGKECDCSKSLDGAIFTRK